MTKEISNWNKFYECNSARGFRYKWEIWEIMHLHEIKPNAFTRIRNQTYERLYRLLLKDRVNKNQEHILMFLFCLEGSTLYTKT